MPALEMFLGELSTKVDFEGAADLALSAMVQALLEAASGRYPRALVLRARVHVRPFEGYQKLHSLESAPAPPRRPREADLEPPSHGAWQWISRRKSAVAFDVQQNAVLEADGSFIEGRPSTRGGQFGDGTVNRMKRGEATHVLVLPLIAPGGAVQGMIDINVQCRAAIGTPFVWPICGDTLATMALASAPYLVALPTRSQPLRAADDLLPVIGPSMQPTVKILGQFARAEETVLLTGPSGVGKSRLARWCHAHSRRANRPFESVVLSTSPGDLQLAHLFGVKKGAFTSATEERVGAVRRVEHGTLFIDEIDKLSLATQASLLELLDEGVYKPVGGGAPRRANVRFLVGTNADLWGAVEKGLFLQDLYYRINVLPVPIPPLDERGDEIAAWARFMAERRHRPGEGQTLMACVRLTDPAVRLLEQRRWPGNLRQLDNVIRRAYAYATLADDESEVVIDIDHVSLALAVEVAPEYAGPVPPPARVTSEPLSLLHSLGRAADQFLDDALLGAEKLSPVVLDHARRFADMVLVRAAERTTKEEALRQLVPDKERSQKNHHRRFRDAKKHIGEISGSEKK